jgi:RNA polymerase sigma factor (sigma-70 family)
VADIAGEVMSYEAMHRAMGEIIRGCHADLVDWARSLVGPDDAQDTVQDALLRFWLQWQRQPERPNAVLVRLELIRHVSDIAKGSHRRTGRRGRGVSSVAGGVSSHRALHISSPLISGIRNWMRPERNVEWAELDPLLRRALQDVTPTERKLISLVFAHDLSRAEAGAVLRMKPGSASAHLSRANKRLQHSLQALGFKRAGRALPAARPQVDRVAESSAEEE